MRLIRVSRDRYETECGGFAICKDGSAWTIVIRESRTSGLSFETRGLAAAAVAAMMLSLASST